jgi:hypothetical protein
MTTTVVVVFLLAGAGVYWYLHHLAKAEQIAKDEAHRTSNKAQNDLMRKALGSRPPRNDA